MPYDNTEIDQSGDATLTEMAKSNAKKLKKNVLGSEEANKAATERQKKAAEKYPDSAEAKVEKVKKAFGYKAGGSVSSASKRADGIATKGKTKGKIV